MKKRFLAILLTVCMVISMVPVAMAAPAYGDTDGHWAESSIERWSGYGIVQGADGMFDPNGQLTCAQLATILVNLLKLPAAPSAGFTDNPDGSWFADAINRCAAAGILLGNGDGTVAPTQSISRDRTMVMLARALGVEPVAKPDLSNYSDAAKVAPYAAGYVAALVDAGVVNGLTETELAPQEEINRASTVTILDKAISTYADKDGATVNVTDGKGITLIVADNVTVKGSVETLVVASSDANVKLDGVTAEKVAVTGEGNKVELANSKVETVVASGEKAAVETSGKTTVETVNIAAADASMSVGKGSTVETLTVTEAAANAEVKVASGASVQALETAAEKTTVDNSGVIATATIAGSATGTEVKANSGSYTGTVKTEAADTTVGGTGAVAKVEASGSAASGEGAANVTTQGTTTEKTDASGATSTDTNTGKIPATDSANSEAAKDAAAGTGNDTPTTAPSTPSGGGHSHSYAYTDNGNGTHTGTCSCGAKVENEPHTAGDTATCTKCGTEIVAKIGTVGYTDLQDALDSAVHGDTVTLLKDAEEILNDSGSDSNTCDPSLWYDQENITLDFNNHKLTVKSTYGGSYNVLNIFGTGWTLRNGEIVVKRGASYANDDSYALAVEVESGTFTMENMNLHGGIALYDTVTATLKETNFVMATNYYAVYLESGAVANVIGGTYQSNGDKPIIYAAENCATAISGGTFTGAIFGGSGTLSITGGTFSTNPSAYVADGYTVKTLEGGKHQVVALFAGGTGTAEDPFTVATAEQLKAFAADVNGGADYAGKFIKLTADIDLKNEEWTPIGTNEHPFSGSFDGQNHTVSNLKITTGNYAGLFGYVSTATIKNVKLANADVSGGERMATLIGKITGNATVTNCSNDAASSVTGSGSNTGGLIGEIVIGTVNLSNLVNNAAVENTKASNSRAGGIVAQVTQENDIGATVTMTDCVNNGAVKTNNGYAGGIVSAYQQGTLTFDNCVNNGTLDGAYEGNMLGWYTSIRSITISSDTNEFDINAIGCIDIAISSDMSLYGKHYFVNRKADLTGVSDTAQTFSEIFQAEEIGTSPKALWNKLIAFYAFAAETNSNFAGYPDTYWRMFNQLTGYSEPDWNTYFNDYNAKCEAEGRTADKLTKEEFNHATWREKIVYLAP